jgi:alpha-D-ribose 1-methylphosphonate 5-triphosphate synthase subunit PhnH
MSPTRDAQRTFRTILNAMAHPGLIFKIHEPLQPPHSLSIGSAAVCLTLLDFETRLWADSGIDRTTRDWLRFHCGCRTAENPSDADFALIANAGEIPSLQLFPPGEDEYPERSATLIIQVDRLSPRGGRRIFGPGIRDFTEIEVEGLPARFWEERLKQSSIYPLGVDIIFVSGRMIAGLPRTSGIES